ncbi:winged helix-turn-helix domain-containing protein [Marinivivus vitaminiproducens]|uniref:winged helix-turn-helix domain-containing protein n=1 Tax=Marinivivus vitaminiproducens TaxID=3035935 RepID=UPI0027A50B4A|nr:response regulator transcription factor [Geminicoccaceae bacterium SCSIO 64248]
MHVLVIEDDAQAANFVAKGLSESGHTVDIARDGRDGLLKAAGETYDVLIVDRLLPGLDGLGVIRTLRATGNDTPVLFLTALSTVDHRVEGLRAGGDDYLAKPFAFSELLARVEALARRRGGAGSETTVLRVADLEMDLLSRRVTRSGQALDLQPREFKLLEALMRAQGRVMTRTMLLEKVWDYSFDPQTNVIDVHISRLRQKVDKDFEPPLIETIRGSGYCLRVPSPVS